MEEEGGFQTDLDEIFDEEDVHFEPSKMSDDFRVAQSYKDGGFALTDKEVIGRYRGAFKSLLGEVGR